MTPRKAVTATIAAALLTTVLASPAAAGPDPDPLSVVGAAACSALAVVENGKDYKQNREDIAQCFTQPTG